MLATVLGLFLGVGLVLGLDYLDHTLRSPDQVERYLGLETLTALPKMTEDNARVLRESFQSLRTAVMLAARGEGCHVLMVTSAVPEEGKTTVAFNLAKTLATGGSRVFEGNPYGKRVRFTGNPATVLNLATKADLWKEQLIRDVRDGTSNTVLLGEKQTNVHYFGQSGGDNENYVADFAALCARLGIESQSLEAAEARDAEPALSEKIIAAFKVNDAAISF